MKNISSRPTAACARAAASTVIAAALLLMTPDGYAQRGAHASPGPFSGFSGSWTGGGTVTLASGTNERIRCRASYVVNDAGRNLQQELRCASDSYKFELKSSVKYDGGNVSGTWSESLRNAAGYLFGRGRSGQFNVKVDSPAFSADLTVQTRGDRQHVVIRSPGSQISEVVITLEKRAG
jgi:hypothetical protein